MLKGYTYDCRVFILNTIGNQLKTLIKNHVTLMSSNVSCHAMITSKHLPQFVRVTAAEGCVQLFYIEEIFLSVGGRIIFLYIKFILCTQIR